MKHDLDSINAAIRLGDMVLPPIGCKIRFYNISFNKNIIGYITHSCDGCCFIDNNTYYPAFDKDLEILSIPDDVPPFEEWKRL